jgi:hypothetical protein
MQKSRSRWTYALAAGAVFGLAACGDGASPVREPVTIRIHGDSVIRMTERPMPGGAGMVECAVPFRAEAEGVEGAHAVMRGGRVEYWWWTTGNPAGSHEWDQQGVHLLWVDTVFPVGQPRLSHPHGFGQQSPAQPLRGEVVFTYSPDHTDEVRETQPFRFYCY